MPKQWRFQAPYVGHSVLTHLLEKHVAAILMATQDVSALRKNGAPGGIRIRVLVRSEPKTHDVLLTKQTL